MDRDEYKTVLELSDFGDILDGEKWVEAFDAWNKHCLEGFDDSCEYSNILIVLSSFVLYQIFFEF